MIIIQILQIVIPTRCKHTRSKKIDQKTEIEALNMRVGVM